MNIHGAPRSSDQTGECHPPPRRLRNLVMLGRACAWKDYNQDRGGQNPGLLGIPSLGPRRLLNASRRTWKSHTSSGCSGNTNWDIQAVGSLLAKGTFAHLCSPPPCASRLWALGGGDNLCTVWQVACELRVLHVADTGTQSASQTCSTSGPGGSSQPLCTEEDRGG